LVHRPRAPNVGLARAGIAPILKKAPQETAMTKVRPLNDRVLVKRMAEEEKTAGGLFIPDAAKEKPARGVVIAVGQGKSDDTGKRTPLDVKAGDKVLFGKYSGTEIKLDGEEHMILREEEILAVLE
jgi:chaperonin GroES